MKFSHFSIAAIVGISYFCISTNQAQAEVFVEPSLDNLYIAGCLNSPRFSNSCSQAARVVIANEFCKAKGYSRSGVGYVEDRGWDNRLSMFAWGEFYKDGQLSTGFYRDVSSFRFTTIECI